jgi:hypothetical protein
MAGMLPGDVEQDVWALRGDGKQEGRDLSGDVKQGIAVILPEDVNKIAGNITRSCEARWLGIT